MLQVKYSNQFKKDYKLIKKRGYDIEKLKCVVRKLANEEKLPEQYREHYLSGEYKRL